ncbi:MAG: M23 family metallopeptidase [Micromonosporaceae bacterium]|nr:M23 family metallopeptidase [Micromonosporaceae bacterium]
MVTTAFIGAGVVATFTQLAMPSTTVDPSTLAAVNGGASADTDRQQQAQSDRASRSDPEAQINSALDQAASKLWLLPVDKYTVTEPFGPSGTVIRQGCELAAPEGTPFVASHDGTITLARYNGALGYMISLSDPRDSVTVIYGHAGKLLVHEGQQVHAGDVLGTVSNTGMAWGPSLYFAIEVKGQAVNPDTYLRQFGLDFKNANDGLG